MDSQRVERIYSFYSGFYDLVFGQIFQKSRASAIDLLEITPGESVLEVGVGTGLSLPLYPSDCRITGIDLSARMLNKGRKKLRKKNLSNVTLKKMDVTQMDFPDNSFDSVLAAYVISTVPEPRMAVQEMVRVCKEGGRIVFLNHFKNGRGWISLFEKSVSPICRRIGFRTDLDLGIILKNTPLLVNQKRKLHRFHFWKAVQCINQKSFIPSIEDPLPKSKRLTEENEMNAIPESLEISQDCSPGSI